MAELRQTSSGRHKFDKVRPRLLSSPGEKEHLTNPTNGRKRPAAACRNDRSMPRSMASTPARLWTPSAITFFVNGAVYGIWATQVPIAKARLGVTEADMGLLLLAMGLGAVIAMSLSPHLITRFGAARIIASSFAVFLLSLLGISLAAIPSVFAPVLLLFGASGGM